MALPFLAPDMAQPSAPYLAQIIAPAQVQSRPLALDYVLSLIPSTKGNTRVPPFDEIEAALAAQGIAIVCGDTDQFATINNVKAQTVRKRYCLEGSYFGLRPKKLANRKLLWMLIRVTPGAISANDCDFNDGEVA